MKKIRLVSVLVLAVLVLIVVLQNTGPVETKLLFATVIMPRALLLFTTALIGFALGILTSLVWLRSGSKSGS